MSDRMRFTILGCGSSPGVPRVNGDWGACDPLNQKNHRLRCSLLVERISATGKTVIVVDTSPDFRQQMLSAQVERIDAVLYTHPHADHVHGIDDLRGFALSQREQIPVYADYQTQDRLIEGFNYCFAGGQFNMYPPILQMNTLATNVATSVSGEGGAIHILPVLQTHGPIHSLGFRFSMDENLQSGGLCYSSDVSAIPQESLPLLQALDVWILDALQYKPHISHFSVSEALEITQKLLPTRAILTHLHIPLDYETLRSELPGNIEPAFDGMVIEL